MRKNLFSVGALILASTLMFTACSGKKSDKKPEVKKTIAGKLIDSEIQGVSYKTESFSGTTDESGSYSCKEGETVSFFLSSTSADIPVGSVTCREITSPIELVLGDEYSIETELNDLPEQEKQAVLNVLRLVQSLDKDGDPSNGITIEKEAVDALAAEILSFDQNYEPEEDGLLFLAELTESETSTLLTTVITSLGGQYVAVSEGDAFLHFTTTQAKIVDEKKPEEEKEEEDEEKQPGEDEDEDEQTPPVQGGEQGQEPGNGSEDEEDETQLPPTGNDDQNGQEPGSDNGEDDQTPPAEGGEQGGDDEGQTQPEENEDEQTPESGSGESNENQTGEGEEEEGEEELP